MYVQLVAGVMLFSLHLHFSNEQSESEHDHEVSSEILRRLISKIRRFIQMLPFEMPINLPEIDQLESSIPPNICKLLAISTISTVFFFSKNKTKINC